mmetsp:Transcript_55782/g.118669  ORF Transcript_55782/g.118669 Transcript_55782/m.118669 type:complete len:154 (+) Transcript_55782:346-807(+)
MGVLVVAFMLLLDLNHEVDLALMLRSYLLSTSRSPLPPCLGLVLRLLTANGHCCHGLDSPPDHHTCIPAGLLYVVVILMVRPGLLLLLVAAACTLPPFSPPRYCPLSTVQYAAVKPSPSPPLVVASPFPSSCITPPVIVAHFCEQKMDDENNM